jgi:hypothetical protein
MPNTNCEVIIMAKKGMKRPEFSNKKNTVSPVPIISGKAKSEKIKANPLIPGTNGKVYHTTPHAESKIPDIFPAIDNDLAVENFTNDFDMTAADMQDLQ